MKKLLITIFPITLIFTVLLIHKMQAVYNITLATQQQEITKQEVYISKQKKTLENMKGVSEPIVKEVQRLRSEVTTRITEKRSKKK